MISEIENGWATKVIPRFWVNLWCVRVGLLLLALGMTIAILGTTGTAEDIVGEKLSKPDPPPPPTAADQEPEQDKPMFVMVPGSKEWVLYDEAFPEPQENERARPLTHESRTYTRLGFWLIAGGAMCGALAGFMASPGFAWRRPRRFRITSAVFLVGTVAITISLSQLTALLSHQIAIAIAVLLFAVYAYGLAVWSNSMLFAFQAHLVGQTWENALGLEVQDRPTQEQPVDDSDLGPATDTDPDPNLARTTRPHFAVLAALFGPIGTLLLFYETFRLAKAASRYQTHLRSVALTAATGDPIEDHVECWKCKHRLDNTPGWSNCPGCGAVLADTVTTFPIARSPVGHIYNARTGTIIYICLAASVPVFLIFSFVMGVLLSRHQAGDQQEDLVVWQFFQSVVGVSYSVIGYIAIKRLTPPWRCTEGLHETAVTGGFIRSVYLASLIVQVLYHLLASAVVLVSLYTNIEETLPIGVVGWDGMLGLFFGFTFLVITLWIVLSIFQHIAFCMYFRRLAITLQSRRLYRWAEVMVWLVPILSLPSIILITSQVPRAVFVGMITMVVTFFVYSTLYIIWMSMLHSSLSRLLKISRLADSEAKQAGTSPESQTNAPKATEYFVTTTSNSREHGPFQSDQLKAWAKLGTLQPTDRISADRRSWIQASRLKGLKFAGSVQECTAPSVGRPIDDLDRQPASASDND